VNPTEIVIGSVSIIVATTIVRRLREHKVSFSPVKGPKGIGAIIVFGFLLTIALLMIAIFAPRIAIALCYLGLVGAFALNGPAVFSYIGDIGRYPVATATGKASGAVQGGVQQ
jgi:hypothetical protein